MKYLIDTCVLSELAKRKPNPRVVKWLKDHSATNLFFVSAVTVGEIQEGIETLPDEDPRKEKLRAWFGKQILETYEGNIIAFDKQVALKWGEIRGGRTAWGSRAQTLTPRLQRLRPRMT